MNTEENIVKNNLSIHENLGQVPQTICSSEQTESAVLIPPPPPPPGFEPMQKTFAKEVANANIIKNVSCDASNKSPEEYVPIPVTSRIKDFEKKQVEDSDSNDERASIQPNIKPVGPWVRKTSSGPVAPADGWECSPPPDTQTRSDTTLSTSSSSSKASVDEPKSQKAHQFAPQQYMSPAQIHRAKQQSPKAQPIKNQCKPAQGKSSAPRQTQSRKSPLPEQPKITRQQPIQKDAIPAHVRENLQPRQRSGSTSEELNQDYSFAVEERRCSKPNGTETIEEGKVASVPALKDPWCDPEHPRVISFHDVSAASFKIKSGILHTPCTRSHMSDITDMEIYFKKDFNQYTGSFKERGARYTLLMLDEEQKKKGVIAASAGNHALGLCYHGKDLGIPVTVVMPLVAPIMKVQACRQYGATILVRGKDIGECRAMALEMARDQGLLYINGYDHPHILAGQGTMGLEIVEQVPDIDAVVIPVGGGGLIAGVALAVKALYPHIQVIGVESERCASFSAAMKNGSPTYIKAESTLADGLAVPTVGVNAFATAAPLIDKMVTVKEEWIAIAILRLVELEKAVVEGAGATGLAGILAGKLPELKGKRVVLPLCGGNIDTTVLGRCLERGLAADGRLVKFTVTVSDRPGGIAELTRMMANLGVSIKDMTHERAWIRSDIFSVEVKVLCETRDRQHSWELKDALQQKYERLRFHVDL